MIGAAALCQLMQETLQNGGAGLAKYEIERYSDKERCCFTFRYRNMARKEGAGAGGLLNGF